MRHYSALEEQRIRVQAEVREWTGEKLLESSQRERLESDLRVEVKRTNGFLRAGLALFTLLIVAALFLLCTLGLELSGRLELVATAGLLALTCIGLAELLAARFRFYRFGVEEALVVAALLLLAFAAAELAAGAEYRLFRTASRIAGLTVAAAGGFVSYRRFGFVYAAIGSMACAALIPFQMDLPPAARCSLAAVTLTLVFVIARSKRLEYQDDYPGDEYAVLQAAALAGIYIVLNLQLKLDVFDVVNVVDVSPLISSGAFYWFTYVMTWILPIAGLGLGIRDKDRVLMDVSVTIAVVTLLTNKPYLGWPRHEWDPMLLGVLLMTVAIGLQYWLSSGPRGQRRGFTSARLFGRESTVLTVLSMASAAYRPDSASSVSGSPRDAPAGPPDFSGGRSGGAGGGGAY
jgi:hypothetical protein